MTRKAAALLLALASLVVVVSIAAAAPAGGTEAEVTVGSDDAKFSHNKQNEPAVAVDANHPLTLAAGANDNIDLELCDAGPDDDCPFTDGVGVSGIYFSFDGGKTWTQPNYPGYSARNCVGEPGDSDECDPEPPSKGGLIGTLPKYFENGLVSDGDPAVAFGPRPGRNGRFKWSNGSRLYYANLTSNFPGKGTFKGFEAIAVSRTDHVHTAALGGDAGKAAWKRPVIVSRQSSATFADKEQIWADNAASSRFFGNVYVCWANFVGNGAEALHVARSTNGGSSWSQKQVTPASAVPPKHWGHSGCTIRTTSQGVVDVFYEAFQSPFRFLPPHGTINRVRSFDGGVSWTRPRIVFRITDPCFYVEPSTGRCVEDGIAGARNDLAASPSVDIANGAPSGADATDEAVLAWADGRMGLNHEKVLFAYKMPGAAWYGPTVVSDPGDRGYYAAPGIAPDGSAVYLTYNAFTTPFRDDTDSPRNLVGVFRQSSLGASGTPTGWTTLDRSPGGDPRASSQNNLVAEFLGDYVYTAATRSYGVGVYNDVREAVDCPAIDDYRMEYHEAAEAGTVRPEDEDLPESRTEQEQEDEDGAPEPPAPNQDCLPTWGNSDIWSFTTAP